MDLDANSIRWIFIGLFVLLVSVALHEFGHAFMAYRLGDDTPKKQGRVTLNPLAHADPIGTVLLPLMGGIYAAAGGSVGGFGWGKPVQWQPHRIRRGIKVSTASILVAFAGPFMNLVLGTIVVIVHVILLKTAVITVDPHAKVSVDLVLQFAAVTNFVLFFFNLIPVPPLDGGHIAQAFMPYKHRSKYDEVARYGPFIILGIMLIPVFRKVFLWPAIWLVSHLYAAGFSIAGM